MRKAKTAYLLYIRKIGKEGIIPLGVFPGTDTGRIAAKNKARALAMESAKCDEKGLYEELDRNDVWIVRSKVQAGEGSPVWVVRTTPYFGG